MDFSLSPEASHPHFTLATPGLLFQREPPTRLHDGQFPMLCPPSQFGLPGEESYLAGGCLGSRLSLYLSCLPTILGTGHSHAGQLYGGLSGQLGSSTSRLQRRQIPKTVTMIGTSSLSSSLCLLEVGIVDRCASLHLVPHELPPLLKNMGDTRSYGFCFMLHIWGLEEHCLDGVYGLDGRCWLGEEQG